MTTLVEDVDAVTAGYLKALKSNSDEIARLAEALRKAEAALATIQEHKQAADLHIVNQDGQIIDLQEERDFARQDAERLANALQAVNDGFKDKSIVFTKHRQSDSDPYHEANRLTTDALAAHAAATKQGD